MTINYSTAPSPLEDRALSFLRECASDTTSTTPSVADSLRKLTDSLLDSGRSREQQQAKETAASQSFICLMEISSNKEELSDSKAHVQPIVQQSEQSGDISNIFSRLVEGSNSFSTVDSGESSKETGSSLSKPKLSALSHLIMQELAYIKVDSCKFSPSVSVNKDGYVSQICPEKMTNDDFKGFAHLFS